MSQALSELDMIQQTSRPKLLSLIIVRMSTLHHADTSVQKTLNVQK